jgi:hypothetical protein
MVEIVTCYYFGKYSKDSYNGHVLYAGNRQVHDYDLPDDFPIRYPILDGGLLPPKMPQTQGRAELIRLREWTIITFWDRSADTRGQSNSAFVIRGALDFTEAVRLAMKFYPQIWERFGFEVYQR